MVAGKPKGYKPPAVEVQKIADKLTLEMRRAVTGQWFDDTGKAFRFPPEEFSQFEAEDIKENYDNISRMTGMPQSIVGSIIKQIKKGGRKATLENIIKAYGFVKAEEARVKAAGDFQ